MTPVRARALRPRRLSRRDKYSWLVAWLTGVIVIVGAPGQAGSHQQLGFRMMQARRSTTEVRSPSSSRGSNRFALDPAQSHIGFSIRHLASKVSGRVALVDGVVEYEPHSPWATSVHARMSVTSIDTGNPIRDARLQSPEFFDAEAFPEITFASRTAGRRGAGLEVPGKLTIRDTSVGVILRVTKLVPHLAGQGDARRVKVTARARIRRSDFGIGAAAMLEAGGILLGDDVSIELDLVLVPA